MPISGVHDIARLVASNQLREYYRLAPGWRGYSSEHGSFIYFNAARLIQLKTDDTLALAAKQIYYQLQSTSTSLIYYDFIPAEAEILSRMFDMLGEAGVIWPRARTAVTDESIFSRNIAFWSLFSERLEEATEIHVDLCKASVTLIGVGGFGTWMAYLLAGSGIGRLTLIDDDVVSKSNLSRQMLFNEQDIGTPKVEAASARLLSVFPQLKIDALNLRITNAADLDGRLHDQALVIVPVGLPKPGLPFGNLRSAIIDACSRAGAPIMFAGSGFVGPILTRPSQDVLSSFIARPSVAAALSTTAPDNDLSDGGVQPALACRLAMTASLCAWEATRYLAGLKCYAVNQMISTDTLHYSKNGIFS